MREREIMKIYVWGEGEVGKEGRIEEGRKEDRGQKMQNLE